MTISHVLTLIALDGNNRVTGRFNFAGKAQMSALKYCRLARLQFVPMLLLCTGTGTSQGVLTLTPGVTVSTQAGTPRPAYTGDSGPASAASLFSPSSVARDASGNLFIADMRNHVVRQIATDGLISTVAGNGDPGYSGDGGPAAAAMLDTPTGVAIDAAGTLFIADSHNNRIRQVSHGVITTVAGTGAAGYSGDNGPGSSAQLASPNGVALDTAGALYIADTGNDRVRKLALGQITTIAGNGERFFAGDGGPAISASLAAPTACAVDANGVLFIADRSNHRIRAVSTSGVITTVAGNGTAAFSGDGGAATAASLAKPSGISLDSSGNFYIADTDNQRVRQVDLTGTIHTLAGTGIQGFTGDGTSLLSASFNAPKSTAVDAFGNLTVADTLNHRIRLGSLPGVSFSSQYVGTTSAPISVTLSNTGTADLTVTQIQVAGAFLSSPGGTCPLPPTTLRPHASCTTLLAFAPIRTGPASGSLKVSSPRTATQTVLLSGIAIPGRTTTTLTVSSSLALVSEPIRFAATVQGIVPGSIAGNITFLDGAVSLATVPVDLSNTASLTTTSLGPGSHTITAIYSGNVSVQGSTSLALQQEVEDFSLGLSSKPSSVTTAGIVQGGSATYYFYMKSFSGPFTFPIALSAQGLPPGATVNLSPEMLPAGAAACAFRMTVKTADPLAVAARNTTSRVYEALGAGVLLLMPIAASSRKRAVHWRSVLVIGLLFSGQALSGCGFMGQGPTTYYITVTGTAHSATGALKPQVTTVELAVL